MSTGIELLFCSPRVAVRRAPLPGSRQPGWNASAPMYLLMDASDALRPAGCDAVAWRRQPRSRWMDRDSPSRWIEMWSGHPATGWGQLTGFWHAQGRVLDWGGPPDNGPVRHFVALHYTLNRAFSGDVDREFGRFCRAMGPALAALDGWVRDPGRGQYYRWVPQVGYVAGLVGGTPGAPLPRLADMPSSRHTQG